MKHIADKILHSIFFNSFIIVSTLFSIFARDFAEGWLDASFDPVIERILIFCFILSCFESILLIISDRRWYHNFLFWISFFAAASMMHDLLLFSSPFFVMNLSQFMIRLGRVLRILKLFVFGQIKMICNLFKGEESRQYRTRMNQIRKSLSKPEKVSIWNRIEKYSAGIIFTLLMVLYIIAFSMAGRISVLPPEENNLIFLMERGVNIDQNIINSFVENNDNLYYLESGAYSAGIGTVPLEALRKSEIRNYAGNDYSIIADISHRIGYRARCQTYISLSMILFIFLFLILIDWIIFHFSFEVSGAFKNLARVLEERDPYTRMHSRHVAEYALLTAKEMGLSEKTQQVVHLAGELHDIGKIGVPEAILQKPESLDNNEYMVVRKHPKQGVRIISPLTNLDSVLLGVYYHHELFDGTGYPEGLKGLEIPLVARILSVCDVWDALTTDRPYRKALDNEQARIILLQGKKREYDPQVVNAFLKCRAWEIFENEKRTAIETYLG